MDHKHPAGRVKDSPFPSPPRQTEGGEAEERLRQCADSVVPVSRAACGNDVILCVASDLKYPDRIGETYSIITYNPNQRYYYFPKMQADEAVLIRCFDLAREGAARFSAHTGFDDPTSPPDAARAQRGG